MLQPGQPPKRKKSEAGLKDKPKPTTEGPAGASAKKSRKGSLKSLERSLSQKSLELPKIVKPVYTCLIHEGYPLILFCNTCDELVCESCAQLGPHNTAGHVLQRVEHAHAHRKAVIGANLAGPISTKVHRMEGKMHNLTFQAEKLRESSGFIHRDTKVYFENMVADLKDTFKTETAELAARIEYYEQEVREINGLIGYFNNFLSPEAFFEFLVIYPRLWARFRDLEERQHDDGRHLDQKDVALSHKVLENKKIVIEMNKFRMSDMFKSEVMLDLRLDLVAIKTGKFNFRTTSTQDIIAGLVRKLKAMCKATQDQLMVCYFCGNISSGEFVNEDCKVNKGKAMPNWWEPFHKKKPDPKFIGNGMHWWAAPVYQNYITEYMKITDGRGFLVISDSIDLPFKMNTAYWLSSVKAQLLAKNIPIYLFLQRLRKKDSNTYIRTLDLEFELNKSFGIDPLVIKQLSIFLTELAKAEDYQLKEDTLVNSNILNRLLIDFAEIDSYYYKFKSAVISKFKGVVSEVDK